MGNQRPINAFVIVLLMSSSPGTATDCTGNACIDVYFGFEDQCYVTENTGDRRVRALRGPYTIDLPPRQRHRLQIDGRCVDGYFGSNQAWYIDGVGHGNGQQCSDGKLSPWIKDQRILSALDSNCASGYCYPGPTAGGRRETEWYCLRADLNCAWPGSEGLRYGQTKSHAGAELKCRNPGNGHRARTSD